MVDHSRKEYAYTDRVRNLNISINSAEGYYSVFKRGMKGVYQHCKEKHLHRYVAEFDFRHSNRSALASRIWSAPKSWRPELSESD